MKIGLTISKGAVCAAKGFSMIDKCLNCTRKHLRKAMVLWLEARLGHPEKWDVSLGNLAEAADAIVLINEDFALYLREQYLKYDKDKQYIFDWGNLFSMLDAINNQIGSTNSVNNAE